MNMERIQGVPPTLFLYLCLPENVSVMLHLRVSQKKSRSDRRNLNANALTRQRFHTFSRINIHCRPLNFKTLSRRLIWV